MKPFIYSLFFALSIPLNSVAQPVYNDSLTGIEISFVADDEMFPSSWRTGGINGTATDLISSEYERSKKIIATALSKYPIDVLKKNLKKVYVLNSLKFYDVSYGGTNSTDVVYVTNKGILFNYTDQYIEQVFHAELSSIFLRNFPKFVSEPEWKNCGDQEINYGGPGHEAIRSGKASEDYDSTLNAAGFLNQYATSNFENDLNSFAKNLFAPDPEFWNVCDDHEKIQCKLAMVVLFYQKISSIFSEDYFRKLEE